MESGKLAIRDVLLLAFLLLLSLPGLNFVLPLREARPLKGAVVTAPDSVALRRVAWMEGRYQRQKEKFLNDQIGFRNDLVRLNNELDWQLFRKIHAKGVVEGRDRYLFEQSYIDAYYGKDYLGDGLIDTLVHKLRFIQDTLSRADKALVLVFVPSKGRYYPEYFPKSKVQPPTVRSNYLQMKKQAGRAGLHVLDLNGWFCQMKATTRYPLFSKQGIHWTSYAAGHAFDSMNRYLERLLQVHIPRIAFSDLETVDTARGQDADLAAGLNLLTPYLKEKFYYEKQTIDTDSVAKAAANFIFIGDSFFWTLMSNWLPQRCYNQWELWYYFNEIWDNRALAGIPLLRHVSEINWIDRIGKRKAVVLFFTEPNLNSYKDYFINPAYRLFGGT